MNVKASDSFDIQFDTVGQELIVKGRLRPERATGLRERLAGFENDIHTLKGVLYLNCKKVSNLNSMALSELLAFSRRMLDGMPDLRIKVVTSSVVAWGQKVFGVFESLGDRVSIEVYDQNMYPGQGVFENAQFIRVLRNQTKMTWRHERKLLAKHGLANGMVVADICCGIGDFAQLVWKEYNPSRMVCVDHAKNSLEYARKSAADFGLAEIEYLYGDASNLLLDDDMFDFVTCRHSLQVFNHPEQILKELYRICKPGGVVYITNEKNSFCFGEPRGESIQWTYNEVAKLWDYFEMDIELGPKQLRLLSDCHFEDLKIDQFNVTNRDGGDPQEFAEVIQSWQDCFDNDMAVRRGDSDEWRSRFRQGFQDHIFAILHPLGYASWPVWAASGRKPR
ncbi:MAG TPA: methyltransferase domain-containing protein [Rectinemataceae bacterium]|nr:methyltransferase domain-containing protein [Rectinemataceae bacterium]